MSEYIISTEQINFFLDHMSEDLAIPSSVAHLDPIVRCRDCKHFTQYGTHIFNDGTTNMDYCDYIRAFRVQITPDGFCAWGERRGQ